ncbi:MAG: right-handed parallel beta-helix repeat-containing protein [Paludibacter sp.]
MVRNGFLIIAFVFLAVTVTAKNYYVATSGNDSNTALSSSTPWQSIDKVNAMMGSFVSGDSILFNRGDVFYGCVNVTCSGALSSNPIIFSGYGSAAKVPFISGSLPITNWVLLKNNIWRAYFNNHSNYPTKVLTINGIYQEIGRCPNRSTLNDRNGLNGWRVISGKVGDSILVDKNLTATPNFTGATVIFKPTFYDMISFSNILHSGTQIYFRGHSTFDTGTGYIITNHINTLDVQGEWYHDIVKDSIYLYSTTNPNTMTIRATSLNRILYANGIKNVVFSKLGFSESNDTVSAAFTNKAGVCFISPNNVTVDQCVFRNHGGRTLCASSAAGLGFTVSNSYFEQNNGSSIRAQMGSNILIKNNTVKRCNLFSSLRVSDDQQIIISTLSNATVTGNLIDSVGHNGMYAYLTTNSTINKNIIKNYSMVIGDGGGIYTHYAHTALDISENIISDGGNGNEGSNLQPRLKTRSMYFDAKSDGMICHDNTFYNSGDAGIFLQTDTKNVKIYRNTIYDCDYNTYGISKTNVTSDTTLHCRDSIYNNIIVNKNTGYSIRNKKINQLMGYVDYNYYCMPYQKQPLFLKLEKSIPYTQWVDSGLDIHSVVAAYQLDSLTQPAKDNIRFLLNSTISNQTFSLGNIQYGDVKSNSYSGSVTLKPYSSLILIKKGITTLWNASEDSELKIYPNPNSGHFNVSVPDGKQYSLEIQNMLGQRIWSCDDFSSRVIDLKNPARGIYIAVLTDGKKKTVSKFSIR